MSVYARVLRQMRIVHGAMLAYSILILFIAEKITNNRTSEPTQDLLIGLIIPAVLATAVSLIAAKKARDCQSGFQANDSDFAARMKFTLPLVFSFVAAEAVVLFGFVERFMGATAAWAGSLYAAGIMLFLIARPRELEN
jgi:hypothetical protein